MKTMKLLELYNGDGYASHKLIEELKELNLPLDSMVVNFAYTDYGGDFLDRVFCKYFDDCSEFASESTIYLGRNGVLFGETARKFIEATENYILGYEDAEDYYSEQEYNATMQSFDLFIEDEYRDQSDEKKKEILGYLMENKSGYYSILSSGELNFCWSDLKKEIEQNIEIE